MVNSGTIQYLKANVQSKFRRSKKTQLKKGLEEEAISLLHSYDGDGSSWDQ